MLANIGSMSPQLKRNESPHEKFCPPLDPKFYMCFAQIPIFPFSIFKNNHIYKWVCNSFISVPGHSQPWSQNSRLGWWRPGIGLRLDRIFNQRQYSVLESNKINGLAKLRCSTFGLHLKIHDMTWKDQAFGLGHEKKKSVFLLNSVFYTILSLKTPIQFTPIFIAPIISRIMF